MASFVAGVRAAMAEGADAIVLGEVSGRDAAEALVDAVAGGHFVAACVAACVIAATAGAVTERILDLLAVGRAHVRGGRRPLSRSITSATRDR